MGAANTKRVRKPRKGARSRDSGKSGEVRQNEAGTQGFSFNSEQLGILDEASQKIEQYATEFQALERLRGAAPDRKKDFEKWSKEYNQRVEKNNALGNEVDRLRQKFDRSIDVSKSGSARSALDAWRSTVSDARAKAARKFANVYIPDSLNIKIK
jgi:hypothetical protein